MVLPLFNSFYRETHSPEIAFPRLYNHYIANCFGKEAGTGQRPVSARHAPPCRSGRWGEMRQADPRGVAPGRGLPVSREPHGARGEPGTGRRSAGERLCGGSECSKGYEIDHYNEQHSDDTSSFE